MFLFHDLFDEVNSINSEEDWNIAQENQDNLRAR